MYPRKIKKLKTHQSYLDQIKNTNSTITICIGMQEMSVQKAKMIDEMYKNNNNTNGNNVTEADSLYKINVRNCVKPN